ncbi:LytTR family transcriptional regulator DNA-binding domain-containing protein [Sphingobacterium faecale]|uniref:LytTR family transcriptional regulator n=1 Tax=Sphingobacterium faecale TaxID=2803775 RepID=A0ABS1QXT2_9SPHI|nr:LytTR family DNA-binding domain-containing protein [Sphingobacterium faecale]MBL1407226.1 LytTR family transcriptional regulator [Sphingobacterium faecale]
MIEVAHSPQLFLVRQCNSLQRIRIDFDQIVRLEADGMDCIIWLPDGIRYTTIKPMAAVLGRLPAEHFKRCHRSHVINVNYVLSVQHNSLQLAHTRIPIPIGDRKIHSAFDLWDRTNSL